MLILPPFTVGDTATICGPRDWACTVTDPDGVVVEYAAPVKRVDIPLTQPGVYTYSWPDGTTGELVALEMQPPKVSP
jgi:hypothetical protein